MTVRSTEQPKSTLERPLHLLSFFSADSPKWTLSQLAKASGIPKPSCLRALRALEAYGLLGKHDGRYRLGSKFLTLAAVMQENYPARHLALPYLRQLRDATDQSVQWVVRDNLDGIYLEVIAPREPVTLYINPGRRAPLYAGASTRLLLAFAPPDVRRKVLTSRRRRYTEATPVDARELREALARTQETWLALSLGELQPSSAELAAPVFNARHQLIAAISVAGSETLYRHRSTLMSYLPALTETAQALSLALGFAYRWQADPDRFLRSVAL